MIVLTNLICPKNEKKIQFDDLLNAWYINFIVHKYLEIQNMCTLQSLRCILSFSLIYKIWVLKKYIWKINQYVRFNYFL